MLASMAYGYCIWLLLLTRKVLIMTYHIKGWLQITLTLCWISRPSPDYLEKTKLKKKWSWIRASYLNLASSHFWNQFIVVGQVDPTMNTAVPPVTAIRNVVLKFSLPHTLNGYLGSQYLKSSIGSINPYRYSQVDRSNVYVYNCRLRHWKRDELVYGKGSKLSSNMDIHGAWHMHIACYIYILRMQALWGQLLSHSLAPNAADSGTNTQWAKHI